ncbi:MAG: response regulator [Gemmatimonadota bacterium]
MARAPLVLMVSEHEWSSRSFDTVLAPRGYAVLRAYTGEQALQRAIESDPHVVFVDRNLPDMSGLELCEALRQHPDFSPVTPVLLVTSGPVSHDHRLEALRAGAWELVSFPLDAEELLLRLERYVRAKVEFERVRDEALLDPRTGFYTRQGTIKRIQELGAAAARFGRPIACVVISTSTGGGEAEELDEETVDQLARLLRAATRKSDILGRIGPRDFAIVAPDTPPEGAETLADRLRQRTSAEADHLAKDGVARTGVYGIQDLRGIEFNPFDFVNRAAEASRQPPPSLN